MNSSAFASLSTALFASMVRVREALAIGLCELSVLCLYWVLIELGGVILSRPY